MQHTPRIFITGGTGFLGSAVVRALGDRPLRLLVRNVAEHRDRESRTIELVEGDVTDSGSLRDAMHGCDTVIHLVGIIEESRNRSFDLVIREGTEKVIAEARAAHLHRFIQISAIGARDDPTLPYQQAKWRAETAVRRSGLDWTILRPSIIFGPGDGFVSVLANLVRRFPVTPIPGDGSARSQPVAVDDVAFPGSLARFLLPLPMLRRSRRTLPHPARAPHRRVHRPVVRQTGPGQWAAAPCGYPAGTVPERAS